MAAGPRQLAVATAPLTAAVQAAGAGGMAPVVRVGATLASLGALLALIAGISRHESGHGSSPRSTRLAGRGAPRHRVPHYAEIALAVVVSIVVATADVHGVISFSSFGVLIYYAIANAAAFTQPHEQRRWPRRVNLLGAAGAWPVARRWRTDRRGRPARHPRPGRPPRSVPVPRPTPLSGSVTAHRQHPGPHSACPGIRLLDPASTVFSDETDDLPVPGLDHLLEPGRVPVSQLLDRVDPDLLEHRCVLGADVLQLGDVVLHSHDGRPSDRQLPKETACPLGTRATSLVWATPGLGVNR